MLGHAEMQCCDFHAAGIFSCNTSCLQPRAQWSKLYPKSFEPSGGIRPLLSKMLRCKYKGRKARKKGYQHPYYLTA